MFVVDDFFREFDGAVVSNLRGKVGGERAGAEAQGFAAPVCAAGGGFEGAGPDELDAAGGGGEGGDLVRGDGRVEGGEEGFSQGLFLGGEGFALGAEGFDVWFVCGGGGGGGLFGGTARGFGGGRVLLARAGSWAGTVSVAVVAVGVL